MIEIDDVERVGKGLVRPECVLVTARGEIYTADWRGGVVLMRPDGTEILFTGATADLPEGPRPNGIALEADGSFLMANLGTEVGGVWRLDRQRQVRPVVTRADGEDLAPSNFCTRDAAGRLWVTVSSRLKPRSLDFHSGAKSGYIVLADHKGARIVADGLGFTNECFVDPTGRWLYVNETYGRRFSRFPLKPNGDLGTKEVVTTFGYGQYPDGFAFDAAGHAWTTSVISNQLIRIQLSDGAHEVMLDDSDAGHVARVEEAYLAGKLDRPHLDTIVSVKLKQISSIAFGGPDLRTGYLGSLLGDHIYRLKMPVAGVAPVHWAYPLR